MPQDCLICRGGQVTELRNNTPSDHTGETSADFVDTTPETTDWNPYTSGLALEIAAAMEQALPTNTQAETDPSMQPDPETDGRFHVGAHNNIDTAPRNEVEVKPVDHLAELGQLGTTIAALRQAHRTDFDLVA